MRKTHAKAAKEAKEYRMGVRGWRAVFNFGFLMGASRGDLGRSDG